MNNITTYADNSLFTLIERPLTEVDSLVLSQFSYMHFGGIVAGCTDTATPIKIRRILAEGDIEKIAGSSHDEAVNKELLSALGNSVRFADVEAIYYMSETDENVEKQFAAITLLLPDGSAYIAFRGTDSSFIGWKEDFNLAYKTPVPSQTRAVEYLEFVAGHLDCPLIVGGHSKGGNLAIYSAMTSKKSIRDRITAVYDHDGPGFRLGVLDNEGYNEIKDIIHKTVPRDSMIGMLLEGHDQYKIVDSYNFLIMQHNPFSWKIKNDNFIELEYVSNGANYVNSTLEQWITSLSDEKREQFIDTLFDLIGSSKAESFDDFSKNRLQNSIAILDALKDIDKDVQDSLSETIRALTKLAFQNLMPKFPRVSSAKKNLLKTTAIRLNKNR